MKENRKIARQLKNFYIGVAVVALLFVIFNVLYAGYDSGLAFTGVPMEQKIESMVKEQVADHSFQLNTKGFDMIEQVRAGRAYDLGFGKGKMCVCGPESAREVLENNQLIRVATKYPNIAKDYFFNRKHQTVDLIKLNGSIELAPIVGLSEVIVDIVETGSTLKENGLKVLEEVCPLSARMVVNQVSMKMENERIRKLIDELRRILQEEM